MTMFTRAYPLDDIQVESGDGRTVEAYAAVFDTPTEIRDRDGHYMEIIAPGAFNKTLEERGTRFGVFYNHGLTLHGSSSERGSVPIGTPLEVRVDGRGLYTRTRYHRTPLADEVLEAIREGSITGYSFSGRFIQSSPSRVPRRRPGAELPTITRTEIKLAEYGPTPIPAYEDAAILGVRSLAARLVHLTAADRAELAAILAPLEEGEHVLPPTTPTPDVGAGGDTDTPTPDVGAVAEESDPDVGHRSGRSMSARLVRARLMRAGIL